MVSVWIILVGVTFTVSLMVATCHDDLLDTRSLDVGFKTQEEKDLIEALQEVLEKLKNKQMPKSARNFGMLPSCDAGEQCAIRKGARVGKLCGCPPGMACDLFILKCL
ncbi:cocaine- and amphetamine-regulated transcript protein-like [Denticeps clupeoides]|uniref:cocaine- and amphetamine-regulated transcript protein-like n=1 Tax=Denticeps clupeoides TaxID=299321 RepID=UPI0010A31077|nr:cocaine- and amphetamine-regulated transcript protein-like [Denticeps clupeoides]